ncbi:MAG TPA: SpoIIE family protein phosphatase [Spirochaetota bacterium]|nr:SpoIIE family protein phosphatase [Spirochaetota bacterium]HRX47385.1 SpoIIE family protein phosphatase [Spirochaetota bacterium]
MPDGISQIDISLFFRINEEISPKKHLDDLYKSIVKISSELTKSESAYLFLYNKNDKKIYLKSNSTSDNEKIINEPLSDESGVEWNAFSNRETVVVSNNNTDNFHFDEIGKIAGEEIRNLICSPMTAHGESVGVIEVVNFAEGSAFTGREKSLMEIIAMISAAAITNRLLYEDLKKRMEELNALYELSNAAVEASDEVEFFRRVLGILAASLDVERASLIFYNRERKQLEVTASYGSAVPEGTVINDDSIAAYVFRHGKAMNVRNVMTDIPDFVTKCGAGYKSDAFVSIPLFFNGNIVGVLNLTDKKNRRLFDEFEMHVLSSIINHVTGIYRNYSDRRSEEKRRRLMQEVKIASEIQRKNLARIPRCSGGMSIAVLYEPAREVGGDFFDFYEISESISAFIIADVSGKGIPAALFTGTVKNILRAEQKTNYDPASLFTCSNKLIYNESEYGMFVTAFYIIIDENGKKLFFSSAGHNEQMLVRKSVTEVVSLKTAGKPLGVSDNACYSGGSVEYERGDILLLFTDGLVEALDGAEMDIDEGFRKLGDIVINNVNESDERLLNIIRNAVRENSLNIELADDLTVLVIHL